MKKIIWVFLLTLSIFTLFACKTIEETSVELPNLAGLNKEQAINLVSGLGLQISFDDVIDNTKQEGVFAFYSDNYRTGDKVEVGTSITIYFYSHIAGVQLPDLSGLTVSQMEDILVDMDIFYTFESRETKDVEEGLFVGYGFNRKVGDYVDEWTNITVIFAVEPFNRSFIISKYIEGTGDNRAIELTNLSDEDIELEDYQLVIFNDGSDKVTIEIQLNGILKAKESLLLTHPNANQTLVAQADLVTTYINFDGNDAVAIQFKGDRIVDIIGIPGFSAFYLRGESYYRREHIIENSRSYNLLDWDIYASDYIENLKTHPTSFPKTFTFDLSYLDISFTLPMGMVEVIFISNNDGDTAQFTSLDPSIPDFTGENRVRFIGINTPETYGTPNAPEPYALDAKEFVYQMLSKANTIYLMHDPVSGNTDTYGRALALIWADGVLVNLEVVRAGYSAAMYSDSLNRLVFNGVSLSRLFQRAEEEAKAARRGLWS